MEQIAGLRYGRAMAPPEPPPARSTWMRMNPIHRAIGIVLVGVGLVWFLLGTGMLSGSQFSGKIWFAVLGIVIANAGAYVLYRAGKAVSGPE